MKSKGFTLIELLVVVAIISLLSSVVLASVREGRDKAKRSALRQEISEMVKALELYKTDNNDYPKGFYVKQYNNNYGGTLSPSFLSQYISDLPKIKDSIVSGNASTYYGYYYNYNDLNYPYYKCSDQTDIPPYIIIVTKNTPIAGTAFSDLGDAYSKMGASGAWTVFSPGFSCYSLK